MHINCSNIGSLYYDAIWCWSTSIQRSSSSIHVHDYLNLIKVDICNRKIDGDQRRWQRRRQQKQGSASSKGEYAGFGKGLILYAMGSQRRKMRRGRTRVLEVALSGRVLEGS
jgi:hypothetical protein